MRVHDDQFPWPHRSFEGITPISSREVLDSFGKSLIQVTSTQYLGVLWNEKVRTAVHAVLQGATPDECGSFGSNYLGGTHPRRLAFERAVADEVHMESALAFASGWAANYAVGELCCRTCDLVISDKRSHNSIIHGLRNCRTAVKVVDLCSREWWNCLGDKELRRIAVLNPSLEGIGGEAIRVEIPDDVRARVTWIQDECHSFGAIGKRGTEAFEGSRPDVRVLGFSKACGTIGAVVCGSSSNIDLLAQCSAPWIFSTAVPPLCWRVNLEILPILVEMEAERSTILSLSRKFRSRLADNGIVATGEYHISGVPLSPELDKVFEVGLRDAGFYAKVSRFPSRPAGEPCARVALSPDHTEVDVNDLVSAILDLHRRFAPTLISG